MCPKRPITTGTHNSFSAKAIEKFTRKIRELKEAGPTIPWEDVKKELGLDKLEEDFPRITYIPEGNCIIFTNSNDDFYVKWINHSLTLYYSQETNKVIGGEMNLFGDEVNKIEESDFE